MMLLYKLFQSTLEIQIIFLVICIDEKEEIIIQSHLLEKIRSKITQQIYISYRESLQNYKYYKITKINSKTSMYQRPWVKSQS